MTDLNDDHVLKFVLLQGLATPEQLQAAQMQADANPGTGLAAVLVERRVLTPDQLSLLKSTAATVPRAG